MKKSYLLFIAAGLCCLAACNKEVEITEIPESPESVKMISETITASLGTSTKVTIADGGDFAWTLGDNIAVHVTNGDSHKYVVTSSGASVAASSASFTVSYEEGYSRDAFAIFPSTIVSETATNYGQSGTALDVTLPATYTLAEVSDVAPCPMIADNTGSGWTFSHLCGLLRLTVNSIPSDATGIVIQFPGKKVNGAFSIASTVTPGTSTIETATPARGEDQITVTFAAGVTSATVNLPLPTGDYDDVFITPVGSETKVAAVRHIKAGGYTVQAAHGKKLTTTLVSFSVAANKKVVFAPGNLQYQASSGKWRFAENQWTYIGDNAGNTTAEGSRATQSDWIDLFGWGTSGWNNSGSSYGLYYYPYNSVYNDESADTAAQYGPTGTSDLTGTFARGDWGVNNAIGDYPAGTWRTPTGKSGDGDLYYLLFVRDDSANPQKSAYAIVNGNKGVILLPDVFIDPRTNAHVNYGPNFIPIYSSLRNSYSGDGWKAMEEAGAVFFPMAGYRSGTTISSVESYGYYWTATAGVKKAAKDEKPEVPAESNASRILIRSDKYIFSSTQLRSSGLSVRLVRDLN